MYHLPRHAGTGIGIITTLFILFIFVILSNTAAAAYQTKDFTDCLFWSTIDTEFSPLFPTFEIIEEEEEENNLDIEEDTNINYTTYNIPDFKYLGVNYYNGYKETWYSQRVLPGGGLHIPGRRVDSQGFIRDENGYLCVASSDFPKGTILETSFGLAKVYDTGCDNGIIDIYTDW